MKILHINSYDNGGAALAAIRLHKALLSQDIYSSMLFIEKRNNTLPNSYAYINGSNAKPGFIFRQCARVKRKLLSKFTKRYLNSQKLRNKPEGFELFSFNQTDFDITTQKIYREADIIHLHWIAGFLDYKFFSKNKKPVVWTLHDMNPFTGGCHYSSGCDKYLTECKGCPQLLGTNDFNNSYYDQEYKKSFLLGQKIVITAPSEWLKQAAEKSRLFRIFKNIHIPYSLNLSIFKPQDKSFCRLSLNLPLDKKILLFVSADIENKRKGFDLLLKALSNLVSNGVEICAVGERDLNISYQTNVNFLGRIFDERLMALAYSAADAFVLPSREDNLPNVMLESLACGTPVIAFPVGGILDVIKPGFNGILAETLTSDSLGNAISNFIEGIYIFNSNEISKNAKQMFSPKTQANRYMTLYQSMLD